MRGRYNIEGVTMMMTMMMITMIMTMLAMIM